MTDPHPPDPDPDPAADTPSAAAASADAARRSIAGRSDLGDALREAFDRLARQRPREVWLCDEDFAAWPLGERATIERLTAWAGADRRLVVLARRFDTLARCHPRWVDWRRTWSHVVVCRSHVEEAPDPWPTLLVAPGVAGLRLVDRDPPRGWLSTAPQDVAACRERFDALSQRSVDAFPATVLGI